MEIAGMRLIAAEYSTHIRANLRVYESAVGDYKVDWQFSQGGRGGRSFSSRNEALAYFAALNPNLR